MRVVRPAIPAVRVVAEERTNMSAVFGKQYMVRTVFLLVVFMLLYGGIIYGFGSYSFVFLAEVRGYSAGFVFALTAWGGFVSAAFYALNALFGDGIERRIMVLAGAIVFAGCWYGLYNVHNTPALVVLYVAAARSYSCGICMRGFAIYRASHDD
jgi:hypothetical protein